jgi:Transposase DDE domain
MDIDDEPTRLSRRAAQACRRPAKLTGAFDRYLEIVPEAVVVQMLQGRSAFSREGRLSAWVVIWLMIFQRLHVKGTLAVAVRELLVGSVRRFVPRAVGPAKQLSASTSAYSQARSRLPLDVVEKVSDLIFESLQQEPKVLSGLKKPMYLLDGSSIQLQHTKELVRDYPPQRNQVAISHWPILRVLVAHDVVSGLAVRPCWGPMSGAGAVSEQGLAKEIMSRLPAGCGVMGDRNFGVFSMAYHASQQNHVCLFRLTEARARKLNGGATPNAKTDKAVRWLSSRDDRRSNAELADPSSVEGRLVVCKIRAVGGKPQKLYFFTTLDLPADQILEVYGYRWNIETDLRSLKQEVRLHMLDAKSKAMVEKELVLAVAAYNLTRAIMNQAASTLQLNPRQFSFSLAQDTIHAFLPAFANATTDQQRQELMQEMLRVFKYSKLPNRSNRPSYPRAIWPRSSSFPTRKLTKKCESPAKRNVTRKGVA